MRKLLILAGCIAYVLCPIDLIPDFIPGFGQLDDLTVIVMTVRALLSKDEQS